jgi:hypothetical protein
MEKMGQVKFQQDGALLHTAHSTKAWLAQLNQEISASAIVT